MTTIQPDPLGRENVIPIVEAAMTELENLPTSANILERIQSQGGMTELDALVLLRECFEEGCTDKIASALAEDVRFGSKWQNVQGKVQVLEYLGESVSRRKSAEVEDGKNFSGFSEEDEKRRDRVYKPLMIFVDGDFRGFSLADIGPSVPGASCSYSASLDSHPGERPKTVNGLIKQISFNHFERKISGWAMFSTLRCVPSPDVLRLVTQLDVRVTAGSPGEIDFTICTRTDSFECVLQAGDVDRLVRWAHAVVSGVDRCTVFLWQRCQIELTARTLTPGWVRLTIRSARSYERHDLTAIVSVHELVTKLRAAFEALARASSKDRSWLESMGLEWVNDPSFDQLAWPVVHAEQVWAEEE